MGAGDWCQLRLSEIFAPRACLRQGRSANPVSARYPRRRTSTKGVPQCPPQFVLMSPAPVVVAAPGQAILLACDWATANIAAVLAPVHILEGHDSLEDSARTMGLFRLPNFVTWVSLDEMVRTVVLPLVVRVRDGHRRTNTGFVFTIEAETAMGMIARAIET